MGGARGSGGLDRQRWDLAVEPILLFSQGPPCLRHPQIALEGRLAVGVLRKLQAVFRVFPEYVRLLHDFEMGMERRIATENHSIVMGTFLAFPSDILTTPVSWRCVTCCSAEVTRQSCSMRVVQISTRSNAS